jgi:hypothetical protein
VVPGYRPLYWTLFGGNNGQDLRSLTAISVCMSQCRMGFYYDHEQDPRVVLDLGYDPSKRYVVLSNRGKFPIDGPGGEIIDAIYVAHKTIL